MRFLFVCLINVVNVGKFTIYPTRAIVLLAQLKLEGLRSRSRFAFRLSNSFQEIWTFAKQ